MLSVEFITTYRRVASHSGNYLCLHQVRNGNAFAMNSSHQHQLVGDGYLIQNIGTTQLPGTSTVKMEKLELLIWPKIFDGLVYIREMKPRTSL